MSIRRRAHCRSLSTPLLVLQIALCLRLIAIASTNEHVILVTIDGLAKPHPADHGPAQEEQQLSKIISPTRLIEFRALVRFKTFGRFLPKSLMGEAIKFALGQWSVLQGYLSDGRVEVDNNLVENAIRPTAVGKKNWLFVGEAEAGQRSAVVYTIIECCRRRGINPYTYLRDVLSRLPHMTNHQVPEITPEAWAKARQSVKNAA